jgi:hypothetical protein
MNSRGSLMTHRITGDTLAISDSVAMTPTVQPAAAGTQRSRDFGWLSERYAVRVTDGEDIRSCYGMPMQGGLRTTRVANRSRATVSSCTGDSKDGVMTGKLLLATVSGEDQRQQVETHSHRWPQDDVKAQRSGHRHTTLCRFCIAQAAFAVIGRHRALLSRAFLLMA